MLAVLVRCSVSCNDQLLRPRGISPPYFFFHKMHCGTTSIDSDFIWPFLTPYMGVIPNQKMVFIFPISCILVLIFPFL